MWDPQNAITLMMQTPSVSVYATGQNLLKVNFRYWRYASVYTRGMDKDIEATL